MRRRSPARYLAPLALVGIAVALAAIVSASTGRDATAPAAKKSGTSAGTEAQKQTRTTKTRKYYVVKAGDTPSAIADKTGVPLTRIEELNPDLDPQFLKPGDRIRLRT